MSGTLLLISGIVLAVIVAVVVGFLSLSGRTDDRSRQGKDHESEVGVAREDVVPDPVEHG